MHGSYFYFASLRKLTAAFGNMFNEIQVQRAEDSTTTNRIFTVPISYGPRRSFLIKLREQLKRSEGPNIAATFPRMSFEMTGMSYNADLQLNPKQRQVTPSTTDNDAVVAQYSPAPYIVNFDLNLYAMNIDDNLQILEQIVPYFNPTVNIRLNEIEELGMVKDIEITLDSVNTDVQYEGLIGDDRTILWTLSFSCATYLYPPVTETGIIKRVISTLYNDHLTPPPVDAVVTVEVDPFTAGRDDVWDVLVTKDETNA